MATRPVSGILRTVGKHTELTPAQYNGIARAGELVVDLDNYSIYYGREDGSLVLLNNSVGASGHYGSFHSTVIQTNPVASTPMAVTYNTTNLSNGVSIVNNSQITVDFAGVYNIQFSLQLDKTDSGEDDVEIWLSKNGTPIDWSNTKVTLPKNDAKLVAAWNFVEQAAAGDYFELMWMSADTALRIYAQNPASSPNRPGIPSAILTVTEV